MKNLDCGRRFYKCSNATLFALHIYAIIIFCGYYFLPIMQRLQCPYFRVTGNYCILCGYTRMTINLIKGSGKINFALTFFILFFCFQTFFRIFGVVFANRMKERYYFLDLVVYTIMAFISVALFVIAHVTGLRPIFS